MTNTIVPDRGPADGCLWGWTYVARGPGLLALPIEPPRATPAIAAPGARAAARPDGKRLVPPPPRSALGPGAICDTVARRPR